jgi:hypothetical protein
MTYCEAGQDLSRPIPAGPGADRTHQPEPGLHEKVLQGIFGDGRQRLAAPKRAAAMAHGVKLEVTEGDALHFAIGGVIVDPVFVAAEAIAGVKHRRILVGDPRQFVEPAAGQRAEPMEMRLQLPVIVFRQIKRQQIAQTTIDLVEIQARAIPRDVGRAVSMLRFGRKILDRLD